VQGLLNESFSCSMLSEGRDGDATLLLNLGFGRRGGGAAKPDGNATTDV
jgi:hypothetical protein